MIEAYLTIKCRNCGREEAVLRLLSDGAVDFNLDKLCPHCQSGWMTKKELTMKNM
jgi:hypothetical protein